MVEAEESSRKRIEDLIALSLYRARSSRVKEFLKVLYRDFEQYLKPADEVRKILDREMAGSRALS